MSFPRDLSDTESIVVPELDRQTLRVRGADAKSWLNGVLSCDVTRVSSATGSYGLLLSKQGKIQAELDVVEAADGSLLLGVSPGRGESVLELLERYLVMEDAELEAAPELRWLRFHGAGSARAARQVIAVGEGALDWLGLGGAAAVVRAEDVEASLRAALAAGARQPSAEQWDVLRILRGFPRYGLDCSEEDNPHEAGLERRAVSWTKGCYLGQEVVCMQDMRGRVKRRLVPLELDGNAPVPPGADIESAGQGGPVGRITSVGSDGALSVALGRVKFPFFEGEQALLVAGRKARIVAPTGPGDGSFRADG